MDEITRTPRSLIRGLVGESTPATRSSPRRGGRTPGANPDRSNADPSDVPKAGNRRSTVAASGVGTPRSLIGGFLSTAPVTKTPLARAGAATSWVPPSPAVETVMDMPSFSLGSPAAAAVGPAAVPAARGHASARGGAPVRGDGPTKGDVRGAVLEKLAPRRAAAVVGGPRQRRPPTGVPARAALRRPRLPSSLIKALFDAHSKRPLDGRAARAALDDAVDRYFLQTSASLSAYASHAGRHTVNERDLVLLLTRQRFVTDRMPIEELVRNNLPMEWVEEVVPVVKAIKI